MNLKDAFRHQNKLESLIESAKSILTTPGNVVTTKNTYLRQKVVATTENETIEDQAPFEHADKITELVEFTSELMSEREKLYAAIRKAKASAPIDIDSETALNKQRQGMAAVLQRMLNYKSKEVMLPNQGTGYTMNAEGNQVQYRCDVKRVDTINFDRNRIQSQLKKLNATADKVSTKIDQAIINTQVDFEPMLYDINDTFDAAFEAYLAK
ncbi:MAG: hypothetical protein HDQ88_11895 [Clostridia bacterium]|nr:hypothetical protein [Clostridia bacterium]